MLALDELSQFLDQFFGVDQFGTDQGGVYHPSARPIRRLGVALEPWPRIGAWVQGARLDALWLHRPWQLHPGQLPEDIGIVAYHLAFDERLTLGYNLRLADALSLTHPSVLGEKEGRPIGMLGTIPTQSFDQLRRVCRDVFRGEESASSPPPGSITRVAVVGAMTDALVREAADRGAQVYITGQFRQPARIAVVETGMGVIEIGHRRSEEWGLRALAGVLYERWAQLVVILPPAR